MRRVSPLASIGLLSLGFLASAIVARAASATDVFPGAGTLQAAIDAAAPGDQLVVHGGTYVGPVVVNKSLRLTCVGESESCTIDGDCAAPVALDITADRMVLRARKPWEGFQIRRGTTTQVRIADRRKVLLHDRVIADANPSSACGSEQNGFEVSGGATRDVKIVDPVAIRYANAGVLLSGLPLKAKVKITGYFGFENGNGVSIVGSAAGAKRGRSGIVIDRTSIAGSAVGIRVVDSNGVYVKHTDISVGNVMSGGLIGISLDATSDNTLVKRSTWTDQFNTSTSVQDAGTGNCGVRNVGIALPSCV